MNMLRVVGATLLGVVLVAGSGITAFAADGDGVCTITLQLPDSVQPGAQFTLDLIEDSDCASVVDPTTFTYGGLLNSRDVYADDGIRFDHTIGSGNASYQGTAPTAPEYYHPFIAGDGVRGADLIVSTMLVTSTPSTSPAPQPSPTATTPPTPTPTPPAPKPNPSKRYTSCAAMHKVYSGGVAKPGVTRNKLKHGHSRALRGEVLHSAVAYRANKRLDTDRDGVACER